MYAENALERANPAESRRRFRACFGERERLFLPVIYTSNETQALRNVDTARRAGTDGVFLINHGVDCQRLLQITQKVITLHPDLFVGINVLDLRREDVIRRLPAGVASVWTSYSTWAEVTEDVATVDVLLPQVNCVMTTARAKDGLEHVDLQEARRLARKTHAYSAQADTGKQDRHR